MVFELPDIHLGFDGAESAPSFGAGGEKSYGDSGIL